VSQQLTQAERDSMIKDLLAAKADMDSKLAALGVSAPEPKDRKSPDGGPSSQAHRFITPVLRRTMPVRRLSDGAECLINVEAFDPDHYEDLAPRPPGGVAAPPRQPRAVVDPNHVPFGTEPAEELLKLTVEVLRAKPEVKLMEGDVPTKKHDLVDAILEVRESCKG
jgi:hypothetical protein